MKGVYNCLQDRRRGDGARGGAIVNLASIASTVGLADRFAYSMSKGAVLAMTLFRRARLHESGDPLQLHLAGARAHALRRRIPRTNYPGREAEMFEQLSSTQPIGRMGTPEEVAALALYLCSDEAAFITGSNYPIDGGFVGLKM